MKKSTFDRMREAKLARVQAESNMNILRDYFRFNDKTETDQKNFADAEYLLNLRQEEEIELIFEYTQETINK